MQTIIGLFDDQRHAQAAVQDLQDAGFSRNDISLVANNTSGEHDHAGEYRHDRSDKSEAGEGAGFGATGGAVVGGIVTLLLAPAVLFIPGIGPVLLGGTLAATIGATALGAGIGAAAGALVGALVGAGIPEEDAHAYAEGVRRGGAFVMLPVASETEASRATDIFRRHNVVDIDSRREEYRTEGWQRFDDNAEPYGGTVRSRYGMATDRPAEGYTRTVNDQTTRDTTL